jgi:hypothetical protein
MGDLRCVPFLSSYAIAVSGTLTCQWMVRKHSSVEFFRGASTLQDCLIVHVWTILEMVT